MRPVTASVLLSGVASCAAPVGDVELGSEQTDVGVVAQATLYGADDRRDLYELSADDARAVERAAVALIAPEQLRALAGGDYAIEAPSLAEAYGTCDGERFAEQPAAANCSGVLVAPDLVATSAHCVPGDARTPSCGVSRYVFGYALAAPGEPIAIDGNDVYDCVEVRARLVHEPDAGCGWDLALVRLDRPVSGARAPVPLRGTSAQDGESLRVIGFPLGLPAKLDTGAHVLDSRLERPDYFSLDSDTFAVSSGSGVLDARGALVGLIARGGRDWDDAGACVRAHRATGELAEQEEATKASVLASVLDGSIPSCEQPRPPADGGLIMHASNDASAPARGGCAVAPEGLRSTPCDARTLLAAAVALAVAVRIGARRRTMPGRGHPWARVRSRTNA